MPITTSEAVSPKGRQILRVVSQGEVVKSDAEGLMDQLLPGGRYFGVPVLAIIGRGTHYAPDARSAFTSQRVRDASAASGQTSPPTALVIETAVLRVTVGFIMRMSTAGLYRAFAREPDAVSWLDEQLTVP